MPNFVVINFLRILDNPSCFSSSKQLLAIEGQFSNSIHNSEIFFENNPKYFLKFQLSLFGTFSCLSNQLRNYPWTLVNNNDRKITSDE